MSFHSLNWRSTVVRFTMVTATLILSVAAVQPQGVGSSRGLPGGEGRHTIKGRVFTPAGRPAEAGMKVRLEGDAVGSKTVTTDLDGAFIFNNLPPGNYAIVMEAGADFDPVREPVTINPTGTFGGSGTSQMISIPVNLRARGAAAAFAKLPKEARDGYTKGLEAAAKGDNKKAAEFLDKAVAAHPNFPEALAELGMLYMKLENMEKAAQTYEALLKLTPNNAIAQLNLGIASYNVASSLVTEKKTAEAEAKLTKAETHLRESLKLNQGPTAHYYLGLVFIKLRNYTEAQKEMEAAIANGGENLALAHKLLGGLYISAKRNKEAADHLDKYLVLDPKAKDADRVRETIKQLRANQ
jgi:Tfp pilus assembly protein PilF